MAGYTYDEWGKLLSITTAEEGNSEQRDIAELNPLRYRGYYYDNETGYYYLQSRYYDPEIGRFISADGFEYIKNNNPINVNAYAYCLNNPILFEDYEGTYIKSGEEPPSSSGYVPPKGGSRRVPVPGKNDGTKGWVDKNGDVWYPDKLHNGSSSEHWDVVDKNGKNHRNIYPDGSVRGENGSKFSLDDMLDSLFDIFVPTDDLVTVLVWTVIIVIVLVCVIEFLPVILPFVAFA